MPLIPTTAGSVEAADLGRTMPHEHLRVGPEGMRKQWPHLFDDERDLRECIAKVRELEPYDVQTICDPSCMDLNRDVALNLAVTEATGVRFVMATGAYGAHWASVSVFLRGRVDLMTECFVHDLEHGIQGTDIRAGFLKCAMDHPGLTDDVEMLHRAVARAAVQTGAPVMAHSNPAHETGLVQMRLLVEEGVPPEQIQIAHAGDTDDLDILERLLETGCVIGMDRYGLHLSTDRRNATVAALAALGYADRMVIGADSCIVMDGRPEAVRLDRSPDNNLTFVFESVIPALREAGVADSDLDAMVGANVRRWLGAGD